MLLKENTALHIIDRGTHFSAATVRDSNTECYVQTVEGIWLTLV